ncbi:MAG: hypothetical protein ACLGIV_00735 [Actinomycetes bacterium]
MLTLLLTAYGAVLFLAWTLVVTRHPTIGVAGVAGIVLTRALGLEPPRVGAVSGVDLYVADGVFAGLAVAAAVAAVTRTGSAAPRGRLGFWLLVTGTAVSVLRGLSGGGLTAAGNEARVTFYVLAGLAFALFALRDPRALSRSLRVWGALTVLLVVVVAAVIAVEGPGTSQGVMLSTGEYVDRRAVDAASALLVAQGAWLAPLLLRADRSHVVAVLVCLTFVVLLQHRSVWVAALGAGLVTVATSRSVRSQLARWTPAVIVLASGLLLAMLFGPLRSLVDALQFSAGSAFAERSTVTWRAESWSLLLARVPGFGPLDVLTGLPMGSGFRRVIGGQIVDVSPHSLYVQTILRGGLVALVGLLLLLAPALRRSGGPPSPQAVAGRGVLVTLALFFAAYGAAPEQGLVLGLALCLIGGGKAPEVAERDAGRRLARGAR